MSRTSSMLLFMSMAASAASPALAQDFAGPHVDAVVGWSKGDRNVGSGERRGDGFVYGISGGYDVRTNNVVLGVLGEISDVSGRDCAAIDQPAQGANIPAIKGRACGKEGRALFGGARIGYVVGENSLLYALGGYANARSIGHFDGTIGGKQVDTKGHRDESGFRVGAGIEQMVGEHLALKAEYRFTAVGNDVANQQHQVVTGVGFRF